MQVTLVLDTEDEATYKHAMMVLTAIGVRLGFATVEDGLKAGATVTKTETTKAAKADKPAPTPPATTESTEAADATGGVTANAPPPNLDIETVRAAIKEVQALDGKDAAIAILHKYGAKAMSELKPENYAAAYADAKANPKVKAAQG